MDQLTPSAKTELQRIVALLTLETFTISTRYELITWVLSNGASVYVARKIRIHKSTPSVHHTEELFRGFGLSACDDAQRELIAHHRADCLAWLRDLKMQYRTKKKPALVAQGGAA